MNVLEAIYYATLICCASFIARTLLVLLGRVTGTYSVEYFHWWPRIPWRPLVRVWIKITEWHERVFQMGKKQTAGFAGVLAIFTMLYIPRRDVVHLGRTYAAGFELLQPIGIEVKRHLFMYSMTGGGKTTTLATISATWRGSILMVDPKRQITEALAEHDRRVWVEISPYSENSAGYNCFDSIKSAQKRAGQEIAVLHAMRVGEALIVTPDGSRSPFFYDAPRNMLAAAILHVLSSHPEEEHNLPFVRDLLVNGYRVYDDDGKEIDTMLEERHELLHRLMQQNGAFEGAVRGLSAPFINASAETAGNLRSTLFEQTKFLDIPQVRRVLTHTTLPLEDLKCRDDVVLTITAPPTSIREELSRLVRLIMNMTAYTFQDIPNSEKKGQCLFIWDEFPSAGYNPVAETIVTIGRSQGFTFFPIAVDEDLLKSVYPKTYNIFTGEADAVLWASTAHEGTAAHLSRLLGKKTIIETEKYSGHKTRRDVDAMSTDQVKRFLAPDNTGSGKLIVTRAGKRALKLVNDPYFKALPVWRYAADPNHKETWPRRIARWIFDPLSKVSEHNSTHSELQND